MTRQNHQNNLRILQLPLSALLIFVHCVHLQYNMFHNFKHEKGHLDKTLYVILLTVCHIFNVGLCDNFYNCFISCT